MILRILIPSLLAALALLPAASAGGVTEIGTSRGGDRVWVEWTTAAGETGRLVLDLRPGHPLIENLSLAPDGKGAGKTLLQGVDPVYFVTVGTRNAPPGRPPGMSVFNTFFDSPAQRPHRTYRAKLDIKGVDTASSNGRASVSLDGLSAGPFRGSLRVTVYPGARLVHVEAMMSTSENNCAYLYDTGLVGASPDWDDNLVWVDTEGRTQRQAVNPRDEDRAVAVRHRAIVAESGAGAVACFPPPHQFFFPRDYTDNLGFTWFGRGHRGLEERFGFGVRQWERGGGNYSPWYNAPPGTEQRMGVFYLLSPGTARDALEDVLRYTHGDRFPELPGYRTFTSHWHMALAVAARREDPLGMGRNRTTPDLVRIFKDMGVNIVHLAEFHGDGHPDGPGALRIRELDAMFAECRRLSDDDLIILPGEEANVPLKVGRPEGNSGHWLYLFPKPVYWVKYPPLVKREPFPRLRTPMINASPDEFVADDPRRGTVHEIRNGDDMVHLLETEHGLAWTAHPRIKASSWAPDIYRDENYFKSDVWLGAAWKAMPADLSRPRLGERVLDLMDDMANWGLRKSVPGEVDVFKIDHTHELYGPMNVNYLRLDRLPRFGDGWQPVLDALRGGRFFVTTGEILLREFTVGGRESGATVRVSGPSIEVRAALEWTFPLRFAEVVSGDGAKTYRETIDLSDTGPFGRRTLALATDLRGRKWVRFAAWDVAGNGAFSQPVWLEPAPADEP